MKVAISVSVEKGNRGWDNNKIEKEINLEAEDLEVLTICAIGAANALGNTLQNAISERWEKLQAELAAEKQAESEEN